jgi:hypothetical protein
MSTLTFVQLPLFEQALRTGDLTGPVPHLHLDLVVLDRIGAVRLVPESELRRAAGDDDRPGYGAVAVEGARGAEPDGGPG